MFDLNSMSPLAGGSLHITFSWACPACKKEWLKHAVGDNTCRRQNDESSIKQTHAQGL